jgi:hypothetical protein
MNVWTNIHHDPAEAIIIIEEYMYHSNFRIDKEINIMQHALLNY